jgi:hypothetical protein
MTKDIFSCIKLKISKATLIATMAILVFGIAKYSIAFVSTPQNTEMAYYFLLLSYNSKDYTVKLDDQNSLGKIPLDVTNSSVTKDTGSGSQFYACVIDSTGQREIFSNNGDKYFLGKWVFRIFWDQVKGGRATGGSNDVGNGDVQVTVPYFPDGQKIEIYDTRTNKLTLSVDVSKFSKTQINAASLNSSDKDGSDQLAINQPPAKNLPVQTTPKQSLSWIWIAAGAFVLIIIGVVLLFLKRHTSSKSPLP